MPEIKKDMQTKKQEIIQNRIKVLRERGYFEKISFEIQYLGEGSKSGKDLFRIIENWNLENDEIETKEIFYVYGDEAKEIAIRSSLNEDKKIYPTSKSIDLDSNEEDIAIEDIEQCLQVREKQLKELAKELGINEEEIEGLSEIDLEQKIDEMQKDEDIQDEEQDKNEPQQLSEEQVKKVGMTGMNEVNLNARVDSKGTTLGKILNLDGYSKIMVVHSYKLLELTDSKGEKGKPNRFRFALIAQKEDGTYETIPATKLRPYRGENREVTEINDKEDIETRNEDCIFEAPCTNKKLVINQKDPYGIPDVYISQNTRQNDGNMAQKLQDKYDGTHRTDVEVRELFNANKGEYQADRMHDEMKEHKEAGCKDFDLEEVDGDKNTGHVHFNPDNPEQYHAIEEIMEKGKVSKEYAEALFKEQIEQAEMNDKEITIDEAKEIAIEEIEEQYRGSFDKK